MFRVSTETHWGLVGNTGVDYTGVIWDYIGIMKKKMETATLL